MIRLLVPVCIERLALCDQELPTVALAMALPGDVVAVMSIPVWSKMCMRIVDVHITPSGATDDGEEEEVRAITHSDSVCQSLPDRLRLHPSINLIAVVTLPPNYLPQATIGRHPV